MRQAARFGSLQLITLEGVLDFIRNNFDFASLIASLHTFIVRIWYYSTALVLFGGQIKMILKVYVEHVCVSVQRKWKGETGRREEDDKCSYLYTAQSCCTVCYEINEYHSFFSNLETYFFFLIISRELVDLWFLLSSLTNRTHRIFYGFILKEIRTVYESATNGHRRYNRYIYTRKSHQEQHVRQSLRLRSFT